MSRRGGIRFERRRQALTRPFPATNRTQALVLAFFATAIVTLAVVLAASPEVYSQTLGTSGNAKALSTVFYLALLAFLSFLSLGVVRRWRWLFWLILIAFLAGGLRLMVSMLQLSGFVSPSGPAWFTVLQAGFGLAQLLIGVAMAAGYRRSGPWGAF